MKLLVGTHKILGEIMKTFAPEPRDKVHRQIWQMTAFERQRLRGVIEALELDS